jgi:hypothetical protein
MPFFRQVLFGKDGLYGTLGFASTAINAFFGVDIQHVDPLSIGRVDAIDGADFNAGLVFDVDAGFSDYVGHSLLLKYCFTI